jgi:hypothetical protein
MLLRKVLSVLFTLVALPMLMFAQETTSEIQGQVTDGHAGVAGASITAIHIPTGTKYSTTSRKDGRYNLPNLRVGGPYKISVSFVGAKADEFQGVFLSLGQAFTGNFTLVQDTKQLNEIVVKSGKQDKNFNNNHTGTQEVITRDQIERLPTVSRSLQDFVRLDPTSNGLNLGGRSSQYNNITVDGANFNNSFGLSGTLGGQTGAQPISLDAIEQIQVSESPYDVRQGGFSGAGVNTVTKSGTNTFKGTVYTYLKGAGTQGYKVEDATVAKTPMSYNLRGFSIGGPIIKNKLFFFVNGESVRQSAPATTWVPSDATHAANAANGVSQANVDSLNLLLHFLQDSLHYNPGSYTGYNFKTNSDKITARLDLNINDNNTLTLKYNYLKSYADQFASTSRPSPLKTGGQPGSLSMPFNGSGYRINNNFNIFIAELNTRIGNSASNKFQVGYTALRDFRSAASSSSTFPLVDILYPGSSNIYTTFGYEPYTYNNTLNTDVYQLSDIFTLYKGAHEITVGTQDYYRKYQNAFAPTYQGAYQFNSFADFFASAGAAGVPNAVNYSLQYSALKGGAFPWAYAGSTELGVFAQDKWRINPKFTLTYGLRLDMTIYKQAFTDNPYFDALKFANGQQYNIGKAPGNALLVSPRIGFNYDVLGDKTLQVRGGFGIFSGAPPFVWLSNQASNNGIQFGNIATSGVAFSTDPNKYRPAAGAPNASWAIALTDPNFKYPTVMKFSLGVDKRFASEHGDWVLTAEGNYSKDVNAVYYSNINLNEENATSLQLNGTSTTPATVTRDRYQANNKYYSGTTLQNPNITTAILMKNTSLGYSYFVTGRVQKTYDNLTFSVAYSHMDARNAAEGGSTASSLWTARAVAGDPNKATLGYASYRTPNRVIAAATYRIPEGHYTSTSIGAFFDAEPQGTTSYVYNGDLNNDGSSSNDLIYIPKTQSEIQLIASGSYSNATHTGSTTGTASDPRTSAMIWQQLNNFITQDHYLNAHRGEVAKANAVVLPFYKKLDLNVTQDISVKTGKETRHTLRLSVDVLNVGNLLNKNWGIVKSPVLTNFLKYEGLAADGKTPLFSFSYQDAKNQVPLVNSFANSTSISSRWQMQFGIRYIFN